MASSVDDRIQAELIEKWAEYLRPADVASFQQACAGACLENSETAIRPFFSTLRTSLMGSDIERLRSISQDSHIRPLVENIVVQDECDEMDPWTPSPLPTIGALYNIWPRDAAGSVITSEIGITDLTQMLRARLLRPSSIKIQSYQINERNLEYGPELNYARDMIRAKAPSGTNATTVAEMARVLIEGANVAVTSMEIQNAHPSYCDAPTEFKQRFDREGWSLSSPHIREAVMVLSTDYDGPKTDWSMLGSAIMFLKQEAMSYWLGKVLFEAKELKTLHLHVENQPLPSIEAGRVIPELTDLKLGLGGSTISANEILVILSSSKRSLRHLSFRGMTLAEGSTWREIMTSIAKDYDALTSFELAGLREKTGKGPAVDFHEFKEQHVPEQCRAGLNFREKGPEKRVTGLTYTGADAPLILGIVASHGYQPTEEEVEQRREEGRPEWQQMLARKRAEYDTYLEQV
ncbi:hypothetical protein Q7P37_008103 [Cladosporium fusiforme]